MDQSGKINTCRFRYTHHTSLVRVLISIFGSMPGRALAEPYTACKQTSMVATHVLIAAQDTKDANMHAESKKVHVFRKQCFSSSAVKPKSLVRTF